MGNVQVSIPKPAGGIVQPQTVYILVEAAAELLGKDSGDVVLIKMEMVCQAFQCERLLEVLGDVGDELVADIGVIPAVPGKQKGSGDQESQYQVQPCFADRAGGFRIVKHFAKSQQEIGILYPRG